MAVTRWFIALIVVCTSSALAPAQTPKTGGVVHTVVQPEPPGLIPALLQNGPTLMVAGNIFEGLLRYNSRLEPQPGLAEKWQASDDGRIYTFKLVRNARWHDGVPFTAADVLFTAELLKRIHPRARVNLAKVESVSAPDEHTVVFALKEPFGPFLGIFEAGSFPIMPRHIYATVDMRSRLSDYPLVGTGPFILKEWRRGSFIHLVKNPNYYVPDRPYLDEIYWHVIPDALVRSIEFETGKLDVLPGGSVETFEVQRLTQLKGVCMTKAGWEFFAPLAWLWLNNRQGPTSKKPFRQAVMYALNREFARDAVWSGFGRVAVGPIASSTRFFDASVNRYSYDPSRAKALLAKAGYNGERVRLLPLPYNETWLRWAELVRQNLMDVGINVDMVATDVPAYNQKVADQDFDIAFAYLYQFGDPALGVSRSYLSSNIAKGSLSNNVAGYVNLDVDRLFAKAAVAVSDKRRQMLYKKIADALVEDVPVAWMLELEFPTISRCDVKNLVTTAIGLNDGFRDAWLDR